MPVECHPNSEGNLCQATLVAQESWYCVIAVRSPLRNTTPCDPSKTSIAKLAISSSVWPSLTIFTATIVLFTSAITTRPKAPSPNVAPNIS
uniref:Uncharacterized protein n=1 Tax=Glossina palpalis gambiensis TaxID=67801 RepID=A0A1B0BSB9_9MUSC